MDWFIPVVGTGEGYTADRQYSNYWQTGDVQRARNEMHCSGVTKYGRFHSMLCEMKAYKTFPATSGRIPRGGARRCSKESTVISGPG